MGYVAIKGGGKAIKGAENLLEYIRCSQGNNGLSLDSETIEKQLYFLHSRIQSEGGLYNPQLASLAIKQCLGDPLEASFALRAHRATLPRILETAAIDTSKMRLIRRISATFKDVTGGQLLGPSTDYVLRLLRMELLDESPESFQKVAGDWLNSVSESNLPDSFPKVIDALRKEGLIPEGDDKSQSCPFDITREPLIFPVPRSAVLSSMARAETGSLLALAYSNMRGYGDVHPTVAELRVGYLPIELPHPVTGEPIEIGEILMTESEIIAMYEEQDEKDAEAAGSNHQAGAGQHQKSFNKPPVFTLGYGVCFGHNEVKSIAMAILDRSLQKGLKDGPDNPSEDQEFVLMHIDGVDSMGFCTHYKMPHYVTFQSDLDRLRTTIKKGNSEENNHD